MKQNLSESILSTIKNEVLNESEELSFDSLKAKAEENGLEFIEIAQAGKYIAYATVKDGRMDAHVQGPNMRVSENPCPGVDVYSGLTDENYHVSINWPSFGDNSIEFAETFYKNLNDAIQVAKAVSEFCEANKENL